MTPLLAVYTTTATREEARRIAAALVERRLAACVQISDIESTYVWQGAVQQEPECRLMIKTTAEVYEAVAALIRELHSYDLPAIFALPVERADAAYRAWVSAACADGNEAAPAP